MTSVGVNVLLVIFISRKVGSACAGTDGTGMFSMYHVLHDFCATWSLFFCEDDDNDDEVRAIM